jgi:Flp pilus assembly protein TadD
MSFPKTPAFYAIFIILSAHMPQARATTAREEAMRLRAEGYAFQSQGDMASASSSYQKATQIDSTYAAPHNDLGVVFEEQGKTAQAERSYQRALELNPDYAEAHANMAMLYERIGNQQSATVHWLKRYQLGEPNQAGTLRAK